jgi:hypothetical protein
MWKGYFLDFSWIIKLFLVIIHIFRNLEQRFRNLAALQRFWASNDRFWSGLGGRGKTVRKKEPGETFCILEHCLPSRVVFGSKRVL